MLRNVKRKILELAHRAGYEVMRKAQIELAIMSLREKPPISQQEVIEELERMDDALTGGWTGCGRCPACLANKTPTLN